HPVQFRFGFGPVLLDCGVARQVQFGQIEQFHCVSSVSIRRDWKRYASSSTECGVPVMHRSCTYSLSITVTAVAEYASLWRSISVFATSHAPLSDFATSLSSGVQIVCAS